MSGIKLRINNYQRMIREEVKFYRTSRIVAIIGLLASMAGIYATFEAVNNNVVFYIATLFLVLCVVLSSLVIASANKELKKLNKEVKL